MNYKKRITGLIVLAVLCTFSYCQAATSMKAIDFDVQQTLDKFSRETVGGQDFIRKAKGILVFPNVIKAGFWAGGEYGEGALFVKGKTTDYYSTIAGSFGIQFGAQKKSLIICFMNQESLDQFRKSSGWEIGVDASVALIKAGAGMKVDTETVKEPVVGFVLNQKGLMVNLTLEGTKISKIDKNQMIQ